MQINVRVAVICLIMFQATNAFGLSEESQKILNKYQDFKETNYSPTPNKKITSSPKDIQITQPSKHTSQSTTQNTNSNHSVEFDGSRALIVGGMLFVLFIGFIAVAKKGGFSPRPWGSHHNPPSMKQLRRLSQMGYEGPMPKSSRDAHYRIRDMERGGDGNYDRDEDYYDNKE